MESRERACVRRMLRGEFGSDEISRLFMHARDPAYNGNRQTVRDIGDFFAHPVTRNRGITATGAKHFIDIMKFQVLRTIRNAEYPLTDLPETFGPFIEAMSHRMSGTLLETQCGIKPDSVRKTANSFKKKWQKIKAGRYDLSGVLSKDELRLIDCLKNYLMNVEVFKGEELFREFTEVLLESHLLEDCEVNQFSATRNAVILYAVAQMHQAKVSATTGDGYLQASINKEGCVDVSFVTTIQIPAGPLKIATAVFSTDIAASEACSAGLLAEPQAEWGFFIHLDADKRLAQFA